MLKCSSRSLLSPTTSTEPRYLSEVHIRASSLPGSSPILYPRVPQPQRSLSSFAVHPGLLSHSSPRSCLPLARPLSSWPLPSSLGMVTSLSSSRSLIEGGLPGWPLAQARQSAQALSISNPILLSSKHFQVSEITSFVPLLCFDFVGWVERFFSLTVFLRHPMSPSREELSVTSIPLHPLCLAHQRY